MLSALSLSLSGVRLDTGYAGVMFNQLQYWSLHDVELNADCKRDFVS